MSVRSSRRSIPTAADRLIFKLGRYVLTAGLAAIVDLGGFAALTSAGLALVPAAIASFLLANVVNYRLSARFAFGVLPTRRRYPLFLAASGIGLAINVALTVALARLGWADPVMAKLIGIGIAFMANFLMNLRVVFAVR